MSLLSEYEQRTAWKYEPVRGVFHTAGGLSNKVKQDGSYTPFQGTTVVFKPEKINLDTIGQMQRELYNRLEGTDMLAAPLPASAIHMTLHDLISPEQCVSGYENKAQYHEEMAESIVRAADIVERIQNDYAGRKIALAADRVVNMVCKSLVLMLKPCTERDYELLLDMYAQFDDIIRLPYPLTPHITLAYFKPGMLDGDQLGMALNAVQACAENAPVFEFAPERLAAQFFGDMQHYADVSGELASAVPGELIEALWRQAY